MLWFNNVLPAVLPFMIAVNMLVLSGFAQKFAKFFSPVTQKIFRLPGAAGIAFFAGLTSGYPVGAKTVADLRRAGQVTAREAQHLLAFCNNAGPLFILGAVGAGMFQSARVGYILLAAHVVSAVVVGLIFREKKIHSVSNTNRMNFDAANEPRVHLANPQSKPADSAGFGAALGKSVKNSMDAIAMVGGLIIFFSVVTAVIETLPLPDIVSGIIASLAEVTSGARRISALPLSAFSLGAAAFIIAFGGFSVHAQTAHFIADTRLNFKKYLLAKFLHGIIAAALTIFIFMLDFLH